METPASVYVYANVKSAHERRIIEGVAEFARQQTPSWQVRWGEYLDPAAIHAEGFSGVILFALADQDIEAVDKIRVPVVSVSSRNPQWLSHRVVPDNLAIGRMAAKHFKERLFWKFLFFGIREETYSFERFCGFRQEVAPHACEAFWSMDQDPGGSAAVNRKLGKKLEALAVGTAIFTTNDIFARRVCELALSAGRKVPSELAILGVDSDDMISLASPVALSSVDPDSKRIGREAATQLQKIVAGQTEPRSILVPPKRISLAASTEHLATEDAQVAEAIQRIQRHACNGLTVEQLAKALGMGRRTIEQRFRSATGRGIDEQIRLVRMQKAARLLKETDFTVGEVAERSGFSNVYYFSGAFKKHFGVSPRYFSRAPAD